MLLDSCDDGIKLYTAASYPAPYSRQPRALVNSSRHSELSQVVFLGGKNARVRSDVGSVLLVLAAAVNASGGEQH